MMDGTEFQRTALDELLELAGRYGISQSVTLIRGALMEKERQEQAREISRKNRELYEQSRNPELDYPHEPEIVFGNQHLLEESMFAHTGQF